MAYSTIDVGDGSGDYDSSSAAGYTLISIGNPCNATGIITEVKFTTASSAANTTRVGVFYGTAPDFTCRSSSSEWTDCTTAGEYTKTVSLACQAGDYIGVYNSGCTTERNNSNGSGYYYKSGQNFGSSATYTAGSATYKVAIYGTGYTISDAPGDVAATENDTGKVTVTWTKVSGQNVTGYIVKRNGTGISGTLGDVATYDDTTAAAPVITPGSAAATDGLAGKVTLSLSGVSIANGTSYNYTVVAVNPAGDSAASSANAGYRIAGSLGYQWNRSAGDSDASYSTISGATSTPYDDTLVYPGGRYYYCSISATGSVTASSSVNRGFLIYIPPFSNHYAKMRH